MSILAFLILSIVALYLFRVNPVLCIVIFGAILFFKMRGFYGNRSSRNRSPPFSPATEAAILALCLDLLRRSGSMDHQPRNDGRVDPLQGLFIEGGD